MNNLPIVYLDLETAPADPANWLPAEPIEAPANYRDPDKIAAYIAEATSKAHGRTGLDVHAGRLLCAAVAVDDDEPECVYDESLTSCLPMLTLIADAITEASKRGNGRFLVCGHNIAGFDVPWLWRLAVKHRHRLANLLPYRKWGDGLADTMQMWSITDPKQMVKLDTIARFLGYDGKEPGMDGAEVWPAYLRGEHDRIQRYCKGDVRLVRSVYLRMVGRDPVAF